MSTPPLRKRKSARSRSMESRTVLPRMIAELRPEGPILDYGCGPKAIHVVALRKTGLDVWGYDLKAPDALAASLFVSNPFDRSWRTIYASNVLSVQKSDDEVRKVIDELWQLLDWEGTLYCNYSEESDVSGASRSSIYIKLKSIFHWVIIWLSRADRRNIVFCCTGRLSKNARKTGIPDFSKVRSIVRNPRIYPWESWA